MSTERFDRLFRAALALNPQERAAFLESACPDDHELRRELESLLQADAEAQEEDYDHDDWAEEETFEEEPLDEEEEDVDYNAAMA